MLHVMYEMSGVWKAYMIQQIFFMNKGGDAVGSGDNFAQITVRNRHGGRGLGVENGTVLRNQERQAEETLCLSN